VRECSRGSLALAEGPFPQRSIMRYARGGSRRQPGRTLIGAWLGKRA
jgi:hypothetical protein